MYDSVKKAALVDPQTFLGDRAEKLDLCLVCEMCWTPQHQEVYPITQSAEWCRKLMPIATATVATIKIVNGAAGVLRCFHPGIPTLPQALVDKADAATKKFGKKSSVADFMEVQAVLEKQDRVQGKQEGYCRREFKKFLNQVDSDNVWAHLSRDCCLQRGCRSGSVPDVERRCAAKSTPASPTTTPASFVAPGVSRKRTR